jgi:hypothetical protein
MHRPVRVPSLRTCVLVPVLAFAALAPTGAPAQASCTPNTVGVASSTDTAPAATDVCAPAWGRPAGAGTGRKVG